MTKGTVEPGRVIADRFEIESVAGQGGTATVYRARDRSGAGEVALKIGHPGTPAETERFVVEAKLLSELQHPSIVRYVAHGVMPSGQWYLALEWLDGEDLSQRLKRRPMSVRETIEVIERAADALGHAHERGIIHRDVKPSNLFLVGARPDDVRLLDFGVARRDSNQAITRAGLMLGTLGYMSAEGVRGHRLDARADVFALGCVLFKCITGTNAFAGESALAVLAKILLEVPPRLSELAHVPPWLDELCGKMLAKDRDVRPQSGAAVAAELRLHANEVLDLEDRPPASVSAPGITAGEQRLVSVALVRIAHAEPEELARLAERIRTLGGELDSMGGGSALVSIQGGAGTDLAVRAARCALALRRAFGTAPIALATGRAIVSSRTPFGEIIERAARLLDLPVDATSETRAVRIDDVTAGLLDASFVVVHDARGAALRGELAPIDASRTLLGRPTPCVGRDRELANLAAMYDECAAEQAAQVVLITAPAGGGKSRLRHELGRRLASHAAPPRIWIARGDPMSAGSSLAMIAQVVRRRLGLQVGENVQSARAKIEAGSPTLQVAEFLGELVGVPFPDENSIALRSARRDAIVMGDLMRRAWEELVRAEFASGPLLIVLDDLHWGDTGSVSYLDGVLRLCRDSPLMVLALARPDVNDLLGDLWRPRGLQRIELRALPRAAAEKLVRDVLGNPAPEVVERIVAQAAGNPFFLEELVRAESEGLGGAPATVMAMVQGRLEALEPEARRVLRAASVLGEVFWEGAVRTLLGGRRGAAAVEEQLDELGNKELVVEVSSSRFPGEKEYAFRHSLVREVAYGMLTDADRTLAHKLAGGWLEDSGATDAAVVAEHFERGGEPERAALLWRRAAEAGLEANDLRLAITRAERGARSAKGEALAELRLVQTEASHWLGQSPRETAQRAAEAMEVAAPGTRIWYRAIGNAIVAHARLASYDRVDNLVERLDAAPVGDALAERTVAIARALTHLVYYELLGRRAKYIPRLMAQLEAHTGPETRAWIPWVHAARALASHDNENAALAVAAAADEFERAGDIRSACLARVNLGVAYNELGLFVEGRRVLRATIADAERMSLAAARADAAHNLGWSLANLGALDEALALEESAMAAFREAGSLRMHAVTSIYIALIHDRLGQSHRAESAARTAVEECREFPSWRAYALGTLAHVRSTADAREALAHAEEAMEIVRAQGALEEGDEWVRLVHAEALDRVGDRAAAREAIREVHKRLSERAAKIQRWPWREAFLARAENVRILELAQAWVEKP
jgi:tetratricopeptide (TPR) repeat protein